MLPMALPEREHVQGGFRPRVRSSNYDVGRPRSSGELPSFPSRIIYVTGRFLRLLSVYIVYQYLLLPGTSVITVTFVCLLAATIIFLIVQQPWKGRPLYSSQLVPTVINGALVALSLVLWGQGLRTGSPVRTVLAEYSGAVVGAVSTLIFGKGGGKLRKVGGLTAMLASYIFLIQGWTTATYSPFSFGNGSVVEEKVRESPKGFSSVGVPFCAGILAALCRLIAHRVSGRKQLKRRLHAVTITAATCFLFPFAALQSMQAKAGVKLDSLPSSFWIFCSNTVFGLVTVYYIDSIAEDRLHIAVASPKHLLVTICCLIILETVYKMDFSILGFLLCTSLLGLGMFQSSSLEYMRRESAQLPSQINEITETHDSLVVAPILDVG